MGYMKKIKLLDGKLNKATKDYIEHLKSVNSFYGKEIFDIYSIPKRFFGR